MVTILSYILVTDSIFTTFAIKANVLVRNWQKIERSLKYFCFNYTLKLLIVMK